ncbi:response regulator [Lacihabitans sp. LS3-19]|uniref:response regulator n=1 Tax=Lacihabitans sp. LS3-19 TaxID=2487335 RepID=UPI0020CB943A|nr:response regulator [Lacihabitans sp. LS3-19]MCP9768117.1 response regulator [Lacihabitans sp. LS3-19]
MKNILLAEDDRDDSMFFEIALKELYIDSSLIVAIDGAQLMDTLEKTVPPPPSVIFLDLNMPKKSGFECLAEIRNSTKFKDIPVIIFSTSSSPQNIEKTYDLGANFYICKPRKFENLKKAILKIISLVESQTIMQPKRNEYFLKLA